MRRMILLALGLGAIGATVGCNHTAGICDCEGPRQSCLHAEPLAAQNGSPVMSRAEPIKEAPKVLDK
jgi:hypothetical protein